MTPLNENTEHYVKLLKLIYYGMVLTDPCKKCIVKPCCSKVCGMKFNHHAAFGSMGVLYGRVLAWMVFIDVTIILPWALYTMMFK